MWTAAILSLIIPSASALTCNEYNVGATLPVDGATDVAVNVRPMVELEEAANQIRLRLYENDTEVEDAEWVRLAKGDPEVWALDFPETLEPFTTYTIVGELRGSDGYELGEATFETGDHEDHTAPGEPARSIGTFTNRRSMYGDTDAFSVRLKGARDPSGTAMRLEFSESGDFTDTVTRIRLENPAKVTAGLCIYDKVGNYDHETTRVRVTPFDAAGNEGPTVTVRFAPAGCDGEGCSAAGSTFSLLGLLVGVFGIWRRRR